MAQKKSKSKVKESEEINKNAAGIDLGGKSHRVCCPPVSKSRKR